MENKKNVKMSAPWTVYATQVEAMFKEDPDVNIEYDIGYDDAEKIITLRVNGSDKADAISKLLPAEREFGNVVLKINVVPSNAEVSRMDLFRRAFAGNAAISEFISAETLWGNLNFVVFKPKVVQYYNDDLFDLNGIKTTVYQDLARELFGDFDEVLFSTEKID